MRSVSLVAMPDSITIRIRIRWICLGVSLFCVFPVTCLVSIRSPVVVGVPSWGGVVVQYRACRCSYIGDGVTNAGIGLNQTVDGIDPVD